MKTVAIMQPTYLPWIGYFDLMDRVDVFVFLDSVQFERRSWQQRNRVKTASGELMLTVPVLSKGRRDQTVAEVELVPDSGFEASHCESIRSAYARAGAFDRHWEGLRALYEVRHRRLVDLNLALIMHLKSAFGIRCETVRSSGLAARGKRVDLLVGICRELGAGRYLSPAGAKGYIDENNLFPSHGIELEYQEFRHPEYRQLHGPFLPYMSAVDLLLNEGGARSLEVIRSGRPPGRG